MGNTYRVSDGAFLFNDGEFNFWAVFKVLDRSRKPMPVKFLGIVRVKRMSTAREAIAKRFPGMDYMNLVAWKSQVNKWRIKYPHKTLYKAPYPLNRAMCKKCGDAVESVHRHHFSQCSCGAIAVDGGYDYNRRSGELKDIEEMP